MVKNPPVSAGDTKDKGSIPGLEDPLGKEMVTHSSILERECHIYSGCDVTSVVYVMSYTVGSVFQNIVDVMS